MHAIPVSNAQPFHSTGARQEITRDVSGISPVGSPGDILRYQLLSLVGSPADIRISVLQKQRIGTGFISKLNCVAELLKICTSRYRV